METLEKLLAQHLRHEASPLDFEQLAEVYAKELRTLNSGSPEANVIRNNKQIRAWSRVMQSPYTHVSALGIALAMLFAFWLPGGNGVLPESVAMADVHQALQEQQSAMIRSTRTATFETDDDKETYVLSVLKRFSNLGYSDKTVDEQGELLLHFCHHYPSATTTVILAPTKTYCRFHAGEGLRWGVWGMDLREMSQFLFQEGEYVKVGPKQVRGVEAIGFEISDVEQRLFGGLDPEWVKFIIDVQRSKCVLWVDPQTKLPIAMEGECDISKCFATAFRKTHLKEVDETYQWSVEIHEKEFLPDMPEGYHELKLPQEPWNERTMRDMTDWVKQQTQQ
jgi:hypothetical protein